MDFKRVSPSELADFIGVQRSNVSHVLSGRNNPGSSFIEKLLQAYPELNARWLMLGAGDMITATESQVDTSGRADLFSIPSPQVAVVQAHKPSAKPEQRSESSSGVDRIIIFHSDHTFTEYLPSK